MILIPEQVKFLREAISRLEGSQTENNDYLSNRDYARCIEDIEVNVTDSLTEHKIAQEQEQLKEYRELLTKGKYQKEIQTEEIGVGTKFRVRFDGEATGENCVLVDSIIGWSKENGFVTTSSPLGKSIIGKKEGEPFSYTADSGLLITGVIEQIETKKEFYPSFVRNIKFSARVAESIEKELRELKAKSILGTDTNQEYGKRLSLTKSQVKLLEEEVERLMVQLSLSKGDIKTKTLVNQRLANIKMLLKTREITVPKEEQQISIGSIFSIMIFEENRTKIRRVEMINQAVGDELEEEYVERITPLGSVLYGLKEGDEFIYRKGPLSFSGKVYDIQNEKKEPRILNALTYQISKKK